MPRHCPKSRCQIETASILRLPNIVPAPASSGRGANLGPADQQSNTFRYEARQMARVLGGIVVAVVVITCVGLAQSDEFPPVTQAMLENPDPADWLHWRGTL